MFKYRACMSLSWISFVGGVRRKQAITRSFKAKDDKTALREARKWIRKTVALAKQGAPEDAYRGKLLFLKRVVLERAIIPETTARII